MGDVLTVGSLFAGIGGIDLGLERTGGFRTAWLPLNPTWVEWLMGFPTGWTDSAALETASSPRSPSSSDTSSSKPSERGDCD